MEINGYWYETHMHTHEASACASGMAADMAEAFYRTGYTGIIVTDHFFYGNTGVDRSLPWSDWVEAFCLGYEHAKAAGDKLGLQVFFGWESCYKGTEFLVYGPDKEWLLTHPEIKDATVEEQFHLVHEAGGIISHAHPFRQAPYISEARLFPEHVDAVEGMNAGHVEDPQFDKAAIAYAKQYGLPLTAGSDQHNARKMRCGGMIFPRKLRDIHDFIQAVMGREALQLLDGTESYTSNVSSP